MPQRGGRHHVFVPSNVSVYYHSVFSRYTVVSSSRKFFQSSIFVIVTVVVIVIIVVSGLFSVHVTILVWPRRCCLVCALPFWSGQMFYYLPTVPTYTLRCCVMLCDFVRCRCHITDLMRCCAMSMSHRQSHAMWHNVE